MMPLDVAGTRSLTGLFRPESVVLVGASDKSAWSHLIYSNLRDSGYDGEILVVNKRGVAAHDVAGYSSCRALPFVPDLAYVFVPSDAVYETLLDVAESGIANVVLLSSGFAEAGENGARMQAKIAALATEKNLNMMGPNSLGFNNYAGRVAISAFPVDKKAVPGSLAIISQSGATAHVVAQFARMQGVGISCVVATGNEAVVDLVDVLNHFIDDQGTRAIAIFAEAIKNPAAFRRAAARASALDKPVIILKVGKSELATKLAQAHTGAVTGDDRIFATVCRHHGVIRVDSLESLVVTAGLLAEIGEVQGAIGIISISGGACEIIADRAVSAGLELPPFSEETQERLRTILPDFGSVYNPLDVTGAAVRDPSLFERILNILSEDPGIGMVAAVQDVPGAEGDTLNREILGAIGRGLTNSRVPGVLINQVLQPISAYTRSVMAELQIPAAIGGVDHAISTFADLKRWSSRSKSSAHPPVQGKVGLRPSSEHEALSFLADNDVPVVPHRLVKSAEEAVAAWREFGGSVALKIASPDILHKSDIGGVKLDLGDPDAIRAAYGSVIASAKRHYPDAAIEGCLVAPMRSGGLELFVGTAKTAWGPVIVAGLGGVWIELLNDTSMRMLPVSERDAREMLLELRGAAMLNGYRGSEAADLDRVASVIKMIGDSSLVLGEDLVSLEINPLFVRGRIIEALDALMVWEDEEVKAPSPGRDRKTASPA